MSTTCATNPTISSVSNSSLFPQNSSNLIPPQHGGVCDNSTGGLVDFSEWHMPPVNANPSVNNGSFSVGGGSWVQPFSGIVPSVKAEIRGMWGLKKRNGVFERVEAGEPDCSIVFEVSIGDMEYSSTKFLMDKKAKRIYQIEENGKITRLINVDKKFRKDMKDIIAEWLS